MAAVASDHHHLLLPNTKLSQGPTTSHPPPPSPPRPPAPSKRATLHSFTFRDLNWGKQRLLRCSKNPPSPPPPPPPDKEAPSPAAAEQPQPPAAGPWNLRSRRSANPVPPQERWEAAAAKAAPPAPKAGEKKRPAFSAALSKKEIEEDFLAVLGKRPPRRPKKRPRPVQRLLKPLFPGFCSTGESAD